MSTQLAAQQYRLEQWAAIIRSRIESGMRVKDFCTQHEISENAYYYWLRKIRAAAISEQETTFAELSAPVRAAVSSDDATGVIIELGRARVRVSNACSRDTLSMVMEVLGNA